MEEIYKQLSTEDLNALLDKDFNAMSTEGLKLIQNAYAEESKPEKFKGSWMEAFQSGGLALPSSTIDEGALIVEALKSPIDTGMGLLGLAEGVMTNTADVIYDAVLPNNWSAKIKEFTNAIGGSSYQTNEQAATAVGEYFQEKYKNQENIKHAIATNPASVLIDIGTVLTAGSGATAKLGQLTEISGITKTADLMQKTASVVDPTSLALKGILGVGNVTTRAARETLGVTTGAGSQSIQEAFKAGRRGGKDKKQFLGHLRAHSQMDEVYDLAIQDLNVLKQQRLSDYKTNSAAFKNDKNVLAFDDIDKAISTADKLVKYKGKVKNPEGAKIIQEIKKVVDDWKKFDPTEFHTPEGIDALKQNIWSVIEKVDKQSKTAQSAAYAIYNSTKKTIEKQSPGYAKAMKEYSDAADLIKEIEQTLSLNKKATVDTAIRKLQAIMRNNVSTNYKQRMTLAEQLQNTGGEVFIPAIAGNQLQSLTPQGLSRSGVLPLGTAVGTGLDPLSTGAAAIASSPRIVGETSVALGSAKKILDDLPMNYAGLQGMLEVLYQYQATQKQ